MEKQFIPITPIGVEKEALKMTVLNGQPEIFHSIQGEGRNLGQDVVFCRLSECSLACSWSPEEHQKVLMADWSFKMLKDVEIGDEIIGVAEGKKKKHNFLVKTRIVNKSTEVVDNLYKLTTTKGEILLDEHDRVWLAGNYGRVRGGWRNILRVNEGDNIRQLFSIPQDKTDSFYKGWLVGSIEGDGTVWWNGNSMRMRFAVSEDEYVERFYELAKRYGADVKLGEHKARGFSGDLRVYKAVTSRYDSFELATKTEITDEFKAGYLAGMFDSEGSRGVNSAFHIAQSKSANPEKWQRIKDYLTDLGFAISESDKGFRLKGGLPEVYRFFATCTPYLSRKKDTVLGQAVRGFSQIISVEKVEGGTVVHLTTETANLIVNGMLLHNCDSPQSWCYTQSKANQHEDGVVYDRAENQTQVSIDDLVESVKSYDEPHIVITGGEPLLQQRVLPAFIKKLRNENPDFYVEIETNGTIRPNDEMAELVNQWNVSPKLSNSGDSERRRIKAKALQKFTELPNADFKFVVSSEQDVEEILTLLDEYEVPADRVFLMPLGRTREELAETEPLVKELAQTLNMNFSTREHINRWGDKRGV